MATMQIKVPCCNSIRTCKATAIYIQDITNNEIINKIDAIRCYKLGYTPEITIEFDPDRNIVYYLYVSNRGNPHISIYHIPPSLNERKAREIILETHGLIR
jgi:6-phosphogluconolactonase (cycloisomerase 2 family)